MSYEDLYEKQKHVILHVGDIVYDLFTNRAGILVKRDRRIDMVKDDIYMWEVKWIKSDRPNELEVPIIDYLEEEGLKMSIVVGVIELHSITGDTYEL